MTLCHFLMVSSSLRLLACLKNGGNVRIYPFMGDDPHEAFNTVLGTQKVLTYVLIIAVLLMIPIIIILVLIVMKSTTSLVLILAVAKYSLCTYNGSGHSHAP